MFHPFYIFQVASLVLWSLDEYYYYAVCIFLMSVGSIATALIETRAVSFGSAEQTPSGTELTLGQTMKRLREISRFECDVRVLRNGFCEWPLLYSL